MPAVLALARAGFRRPRGLVGLSLVLALGLGVAIASLEAARRTERAYPAYLRQANVGDVVVNPSFVSDRAEEIIASAPGVRHYTSHSMLLATPDDGEPRPQSEVESQPTQLLVSADGRFVTQDRPVVRDGRMIRRGTEAFVSVEAARALGVKVGDTLPLAFWAPSYVVPGVDEPSGIVEPIGRAAATVVGIGMFADEVLVDELYPRHRILVTPEVAARFDCTFRLPAGDDPRPLNELLPVITPPGCSLTYRYFSLHVGGDDAGARAVADHLAARFAQENESLPAAMRAADVGYIVIPSFTAEDRRDLERSLEPAVRALQLFGIAAASTTIVVFLLGALRALRRHEANARTWLHLGATRGQRACAAGLPLVTAIVAGLIGSVVVGWAGSGAGPVASARPLEPTGRLHLSLPVVSAVVAISALVLLVGLALAAARAVASRTAPLVSPTSRSAHALARLSKPSLVIGFSAAVSSAGARALLAASAAAVTAVLATSVFTTSLNGFVTSPSRFGWPYDAAVMIGYGYGGANERAIEATLDRPDVEAWTLAALAVDTTIDGEPVPFIAGRRDFNALPPPVIEGELPVADDEIALGALTARRLGLGVGDEAVVTTPYGERRATVRGVVVLPSVGPFEADGVSLGEGALLSEAFIETILSGAEREAGMEPGTLADSTGALVGIDLRDGVDSAKFLAEVSAELQSWDVNDFHPFVYPEPVRPAPVADAAAMRAVPVALAGVFALAMAVSLGVGIAAATRARRRELAVLRALGCLRGQLRASVQWHAIAVAAVGLVVGLPVGITIGRIAYHEFASGLGFFPEPVVSASSTLAVVAGTIGVGLLAVAAPAHRAPRSATATALRDE